MWEQGVHTDGSGGVRANVTLLDHAYTVDDHVGRNIGEERPEPLQVRGVGSLKDLALLEKKGWIDGQVRESAPRRREDVVGRREMPVQRMTEHAGSAEDEDPHQLPTSRFAHSAARSSTSSTEIGDNPSCSVPANRAAPVTRL